MPETESRPSLVPQPQKGERMFLTSTEGQEDLPRYFVQVFKMLNRMESGRLDIALPDGRVFRADAPKPGPVAHVDIHDPDVFARLVREGELGFPTDI